MSKKATIKVTGDTSDAQSALDQLSSQINKFSKGNQQNLSGVGKLTSSIKGFAKSLSPATIAVGAAVAVGKEINKVVKETTSLYKAQASAEKQLEVAASNNPYLDAASVQQLKNYASSLQSISTVGDETLIPMMAQLAAAGRTQSEIQSIMSAALDVSASGMMSLDSAVTQLNKTFSGSTGQLGNQIAELKTLTKEELESGKAIDIVAQKFKGMAEETAKATGSSEQLKNAVSDYKELWGQTFEEGLAPMRRFFTELLSKHTAAKKAAKEYKKAMKEVFDDEGNVNENAQESALFTAWDNLKKEATEARNALIDYKEKAGFDNTNREMWDPYTENETLRVQELQTAANKAESAYRKVVAVRLEAEEAARLESEAQAKIAEELAESNKKLETRDKLRKAYEDDIAKTKAEIDNRRRLGEVITEQAEAQELLNVATKHYVDMYSDPAFDRSQTKTGMWEGEQAHLDYIEELAAKANVEQEVVEVSKSHVEELIETWQTEEEETLEMQKALLDEYRAYLDAKESLTDEEIALKERLAEAQRNIDQKILEEQQAAHQKQKEQIAKDIADVASYIEEFAGISDTIVGIARANNTAQQNEELTAISKQYTDGLISYEEYCEKKSQLEKKAAMEEYKIRQWEWTMSLLMATANVAQGVSAALTKAPPASYVMAALTAASGAAQIAAITASKPKPPAFQEGGIVPGTSYYGDRVVANVNSGEMVLTAQQQKNLWNLANNAGKSGAVVNMPVTINNTASDSVRASASMSPEGITILVEKIVNAQMAAGRYNQSMGIAQSRQHGVEYQ